MEWNLGGGHHIQPSVHIHMGEGPECLHHGLLVGLGVVHPLYHMSAARKCLLQVPMALNARGAEIASVVSAHIAETLPVLLRMHQNIAVLGIVHVQHRLQHFIFYTYEAHGMVHRCLVLSCHDCHRVSRETQPAVQYEPVIGAGLRIGLPRHGETALRYVLPCEDALNPRYLGCNAAVYLPDHGMGVRASEHLYHQAVL